MKIWTKSHTETLRYHYKIMARYPFSHRIHFTVTPKGKQVMLLHFSQLLKNSFSTCKYIYAIVFNYEVLEAGVHHVHGIIYADSKTGLYPYFDAQNLTLLCSMGGLKGWIKYFKKDKGKTHIRVNSEFIENTLLPNYI